MASEVASEGIDLQFSSLLINFDLPWNPMKIEQRIGRIDRIGQRKSVIHIWNIFHEATIDERVYERLLSRLNIFKAALGSMENVVGDVIRVMTNDLFSHELSEEKEQQVIEQSYMAIANRRLQEERLEEESSHLIAHGDYIQNKVKAAQELKRFISSEDLYLYFKDYFQREHPGTRIVRVDDRQMLFDIELVAAAKYELTDFLQREKLQGKTRLIQPQGNTPVRFLFENKVATPQNFYVEVISQYHPIIRFISEFYRAKGLRTFHPVISAQVSADDVPSVQMGRYVFSIARWSMRVATRDVERLAYQAINIDTGIFLDSDPAEQVINSAAMLGQDWSGAHATMNGELIEERYSQCVDELDVRYAEFVETLRRESADRIALQLHNLQAHLDRESAKLEELIWRLRDQKKFKGVMLQENKLKKLRQRVTEQMEYVKSAESPRHEGVTVTNGVILVC